jgi:hypothetical protein
MIISGGSRCNGRWFSSHLMKTEENERVSVVEMRGLAARDVREAFREMDFIAGGTSCTNFFYHANLNPKAHERLTAEQWEQAADMLEKHLQLEGHARFIVEHEKDGRVHRHVIWSRIDADTMTAVSDSFSARDHEKAAREIEETFGLEPVESVLVKDRETQRPERRPRNWETFRGHESGIDPEAMKAEITALWQECDSGLAFKAALENAGYILARGDRRDFCVVDPSGDEHSLAKRISGERAASVRARMADVDRESLPSVAEARELAQATADSADAAPQPESTAEPITGSAAAAKAESVAPLERGGDSELAPVETGASEVAPALERGTPPDTSEKHFGWRAFSDRARGYVDQAFALWRDESSGAPDGERGPWERFAGAAKHLIRGYQHRDSGELVEGVSEAVDLLKGDETGGGSKPTSTDNADPLPTDSRQRAERAHGEEVLHHFDEGEPSPPGEMRRDEARPDAQVDASEPDDRPQPETPAVTEPTTAFDSLSAAYFVEWEVDEDADVWPEAQPPDDTAPELPDYDAPDMD